MCVCMYACMHVCMYDVYTRTTRTRAHKNIHTCIHIIYSLSSALPRPCTHAKFPTLPTLDAFQPPSPPQPPHPLSRSPHPLPPPTHPPPPVLPHTSLHSTAHRTPPTSSLAPIRPCQDAQCLVAAHCWLREPLLVAYNSTRQPEAPMKSSRHHPPVCVCVCVCVCV